MTPSISQRIRFAFRGLTLAAGAFVLTASALAGEWGTFKGRFVVEGIAPVAAAPVVVGAVPGFCGNLVNEDVAVSAKGELANVLVFVRDKDRNVEMNPAFAAIANDEVVLDIKACRFEPHVLAMWTTQTLVIKNSDPAGHNINVSLLKNPSFNDMLPPGEKIEKTELSSEEFSPRTVADNIHPWMQGIILIRANSYFAVSKADGSFEIKDLPADKEFEFQFWQEKAGALRQVKNAGGFATDARGRAKLTLKPGETDLGQIKVPAKSLQ